MSERKVRIGMIGLGHIAKIHLEKYAQIPEVEIVAAADINPVTLETVCDRFGIAGRYADFKEMLKRDDLDAVDVCLHNHCHAPAAILSMQAGKHVYCEKPIAGTYADGVAMVKAAQECGKMLHIQLMNLYLKETKSAKKLIDAGLLGNIFYGRSAGYRRRGRPYVDGWWPKTLVSKQSTGGGAIIDMSIYKLAQILYLMGLPRPARISGKLFQEMEMNEARRIESGYDVEELGMGFVRFENGAVLDMVEAWAINLDELGGDYVVGSKAGVRLTPEFRFIHTVEDMELVSAVDVDALDFRSHGFDPLESAYDSCQQHWVAALLGKVPLMDTAGIALQCMLIQEGIYLSDARGCEVGADEIVAASRSLAVEL